MIKIYLPILYLMNAGGGGDAGIKSLNYRKNSKYWDMYV